MFDPNLTTNQKIVDCLNDIDLIKTSVEKTLILPKHERWLRNEALLRAAYTSIMIGNPSITKDEIDEAVKASPAPSVPKALADVASYYRALGFVGFLADNEYPCDQSTLRQVHFLLMNGLQNTNSRPGNYRNEPGWIEDQGIAFYEGPSPGDVPILMAGFSDWLRSTQDIPVVLKAGIAHAHLLAVHPFVDGNGRTARLLATLILHRHGYGFRKLLSIEACCAQDPDNYFRALKRLLGQRWAGSDQEDLLSWLGFFCTSVLLQAQALQRRLADWTSMVDEVYRETQQSGLNGRQVDGLIYARKNGSVSRKDYAEINDIGLITASRDLADMVEKGLLARRGTGRNLFYEDMPSMPDFEPQARQDSGHATSHVSSEFTSRTTGTRRSKTRAIPKK